MKLLSSYLSEPSLIIGYTAVHRSLGVGKIIRAYEDNDTEYLEIQFECEVKSREFRVDVFFASGQYFINDLNPLYKLDKELKKILRAIRQSAVSPSRTEGLSLNEDDLRLVLTWANKLAPKSANIDVEYVVEILGAFEAARLMSARVAELAAIGYYRSLGRKVEDVSVTQLSRDCSSRWKDFDLLIDDRPVDVKNARRSFTSPNSYVEHCVPRFKLDRITQNEVSVVGVVSDFKWPDDIASGLSNCTILGEVCVTDIRRLYSWVKGRFHDTVDLSGLWVPHYQPGWSFEYPKEHYRGRIDALPNLDRALSEFKKAGIPDQNIPSWLLPLCHDMELVNRLDLHAEKKRIIKDLLDLREKCGLSRPSLFVYVLAFFLESIIARRHRSEVIGPLREVMLHADFQEPKIGSPLGLADPLHYVSSLLNVFETVFDMIVQRDEVFTAFRLQSPSILVGKRENDSWISLIAYCGGWISFPRKAKCLTSPLYYGRHVTCPSCGHLVCDNCGYCAQGCSEVVARQAAVAEEAQKNFKV